MKYFTEEYRLLCQRTAYDSALIQDAAAEKTDEVYFRRLYCQKEAEYCSLLDLAAESQEGKEAFSAQLDAYAMQLQQDLPSSILADVADIRVLAMNHASERVIKKITKFCEDNRKAADRINDAYTRHYRQLTENKDFRWEMITQIGFHDCVISEIVTQLGDVFFAFQGAEAHSYVTAMRCVKCKKLIQDGLVPGSIWLYEEIQFENGIYQLNVLVQKPDGNLSEFAIQAQKFEFRGAVT